MGRPSSNQSEEHEQRQPQPQLTEKRSWQILIPPSLHLPLTSRVIALLPRLHSWLNVTSTQEPKTICEGTSAEQQRERYIEKTSPSR
jgi:hypothetical protein